MGRGVGLQHSKGRTRRDHSQEPHFQRREALEVAAGQKQDWSHGVNCPASCRLTASCGRVATRFETRPQIPRLAQTHGVKLRNGPRITTSNTIRPLIESKRLLVCSVPRQIAKTSVARPASTSRAGTFHQNHSESRTAGTGKGSTSPTTSATDWASPTGEYSFRLGGRGQRRQRSELDDAPMLCGRTDFGYRQL